MTNDWILTKLFSVVSYFGKPCPYLCNQKQVLTFKTEKSMGDFLSDFLIYETFINPDYNDDKKYNENNYGSSYDDEDHYDDDDDNGEEY